MNAVPHVPWDVQEERELTELQRDPRLYHFIREILVKRRDRRREQMEASAGEASMVMRGRCQELTAILNELFPDRMRPAPPPVTFNAKESKWPAS